MVLATSMGSEQRDAERHDAQLSPAELEKSPGTESGGVEIRETDRGEGIRDFGDGNAADTGAGGEEAVLGADDVPSGAETASRGCRPG
jgi:hypothetical protein